MKTGKILIIEDSKVAQAQLSDILATEFVLTFTGNGPEGITAAGETPPDLILLDIHLPGMDGYDVCKILKTGDATKDIPIIFITAMDAEKERVKGFDAGAVDYIVKPFYPRELLARIRTHLTAQSAARQALELEKLKLFKKMAVALSHEINNPLTAVYGFLYVLDKEIVAPGEKIKVPLLHIRKELERIRDIVAKLANTSRISETDYSRNTRMIDLHDI